MDTSKQHKEKLNFRKLEIKIYINFLKNYKTYLNILKPTD